MASPTKMGTIPFELSLNFAKNIKKVGLFSKTRPYAVVSLSGDPYPKQEAKTAVDNYGGTNPTWNSPMKFFISESAARQNCLVLQIRLRSQRTFFGDKDLGVVHVPIKDLLSVAGDEKTPTIVSYPVRKRSGKFKGSLNFSYKFGEMVAAPAQDEPVKAQPHLVAGSGLVPPNAGVPYHRPAQSGAAYAPPYQGGYPPVYGGYAPPQPVYGYPPEKNNFGLSLGAGVLGKAVEGMLIGAMGSDGGFDGFDGFF